MFTESETREVFKF